MDGTIGFYDSDPEGYSEATFGNDVSDIRGRFMSHLPEGARILDLGCGSGRDTLAFRDLGYDVVAVDGSEGMCRVAERNIGMPVRHLMFSDLDYENEFDGVWACASLLHLPMDELGDVMVKVRRALKPGGVLYVSFKEGKFSGIRDGRFYTDLMEDGVMKLAEESSFELLDLWENCDPRGIVWVNAILKSRIEL